MPCCPSRPRHVLALGQSTARRATGSVSHACQLRCGMEREGEDLLANPWLAGPAPTAYCRRRSSRSGSSISCLLRTCACWPRRVQGDRWRRLFATTTSTSRSSSRRRTARRSCATSPRILECQSVSSRSLVGQASSRGAQLFGVARIVRAGDDDFDRLMSVYRWQSDAVERGRSLEPPHKVPPSPLMSIVWCTPNIGSAGVASPPANIGIDRTTTEAGGPRASTARCARCSSPTNAGRRSGYSAFALSG